MGLSDAYAAWIARPVPPGSDWDELEDLHYDIYDADFEVAEHVIPFVRHGSAATFDWPSVSVRLNSLRDRAVALQRLAEGGDRRLADDMITYIGLLEAVFEAFLQEVGFDRRDST